MVITLDVVKICKWLNHIKDGCDVEETQADAMGYEDCAKQSAKQSKAIQRAIDILKDAAGLDSTTQVERAREVPEPDDHGSGSLMYGCPPEVDRG